MVKNYGLSENLLRVDFQRRCKRRYTMNKFLNISFLLLLFGLCCFLSCKSQPDLQQLGIIKPTETEGINEGINWDTGDTSISYIPERTMSLPPDNTRTSSTFVTATAGTSTDMISVSGSGS